MTNEPAIIPRWQSQGWSDPETVWAESRWRYEGDVGYPNRFHTSLRDWALQAWQVADDEYLPLGDTQDLIGNLLKRIEDLEAAAAVHPPSSELIEPLSKRSAPTFDTPNQITEMAPGTAFTADRPGGHLVAEGGEIVTKHGRRFMKLVFGADSELVNDMGELVDADELDPASVRDVRPPNDAMSKVETTGCPGEVRSTAGCRSAGAKIREFAELLGTEVDEETERALASCGDPWIVSSGCELPSGHVGDHSVAGITYPAATHVTDWHARDCALQARTGTSCTCGEDAP